MCGRFTVRKTVEEIGEDFPLEDFINLIIKPRHNIAPTQPVAAIRLNSEKGKREATLFQWGLIPSWAKDPSSGSRMINARSETVSEKPSFRVAFQSRRCLVLADGFYEWQRSKTPKQPYYFKLRSDRVFAFAGLWEHWRGKDGSEIETCTLLTTEPNELMAPIHDRMPVILNSDSYELWLDANQKKDAIQKLFDPFPSDKMEAYPISTFVNSPQNDSPRCIEPVRAQPDLLT